MVDAQPRVAAECHHPVVPPREGFLGLLEAAERIDEAEFDQLREVRALLRRHEVLAFPFRRIVHVAVFRRDVVVAEQRELRVALQLGAQPRLQRVEPLHLVDELVGVERLAVREVGGHDAHAVDRRGDHALLRIVEAGDVAHDVRFVDDERVAREDRDTVVGLLAREPAAVTGRLEIGAREFLVRQLQLLQAQYVGAALREPVEHVLFADVERVDVPGGYFHEREGRAA